MEGLCYPHSLFACLLADLEFKQRQPEVEKSQVTLGLKLGQGAFGEVRYDIKQSILILHTELCLDMERLLEWTHCGSQEADYQRRDLHQGTDGEFPQRICQTEDI